MPLSYKTKLLTNFTALFALFAIILVVFQSQREEQYKMDLLESRLRSYADLISGFECIKNKDIDIKKLNLTSDTKWVQDFKGNNILIFTSEWNINWALDKNEGLILEDFNK